MRWAVPVALAASILLAIAINLRSPEIQLPVVGTISYVAANPGLNDALFAVGDTVHAGDVIETDGLPGLSISLPGDISLRVNTETTIRLERAGELTLIQGQVYADSGDRIYRDRHITIHTAGGSATDIGTQFSVSFRNDQLNIAVREGRVDIENDQDTFTAEAGDRLTIQPGNEVILGKITPYDASWQWASSLAPGFEVENQSLLDFLKWATRETGKELIFASDEQRMAAMGTTLFGSVRDFRPMDAIESVLSTTRFGYRMDEQSITILN